VKSDEPLLYDPIEEANERLLNALAQLKEARQIHKAFMSLGKELSVGSGQEVLLGVICEAVRSLFPHAYFLVQLTDPTSPRTLACRHHGPLLPETSERIHLTTSAISKTRLDNGALQASCVEISEELPCLFADSQHAIHVPLVSEGMLYGAIQIEAPAGASLGDDDEVLLISLANQMALALRNQRLLDETAYLKDYMENILEHANALIAVTDRNRQTMVFNRALEKLLGIGKDEVIGQDFFKWVPPEDHQRFAREVSLAINSQPTATGLETRLRNREGQLVQIVFHLAALRDRQGEIDSIIMVGQDITPLRELERQIIEAEKMASLGKLAAGVVHELNNPLTSISVYAEYLLKKIASGQVDASDAEKMQRILEGARRIQKLTRDLVSYSRPSTDEPEALDINEVVDQGLSFCEHTISKYDVRVNRDLADNLPALTGIRNQLLQMVINLITNACQAMEGGGELSLTTRNRGREVMLQVSDTGVGIAERDMDRLFEPFFTTKQSGQGTGLGLSIVARIIEHHRGRVEVTSRRGEGTTFEIHLPLGEQRN